MINVTEDLDVHKVQQEPKRVKVMRIVAYNRDCFILSYAVPEGETVNAPYIVDF